MKINPWHIFSLSFLLTGACACGLFNYRHSAGPEHYGEKYENVYLKINIDSWRHKDQYHKQLSGIIRDSSGKILAQYNIQNLCGCVSKHILSQGANQYKLTTDSSFDIGMSETDKFVFKKFSDHPLIAEFCSRSLLDSAKGFVRIQKKHQKSEK